MRLEDAMRQMSGEPELARESTGEALSVTRSVEASTAIHAIEHLGTRRQLPNRRMRTRMSWWCGRGVAGRTRYPLSRFFLLCKAVQRAVRREPSNVKGFVGRVLAALRFTVHAP